jgi:hypothetical protein
LTASYVLNTGQFTNEINLVTGSSYPITSSWAVFSTSSSYTYRSDLCDFSILSGDSITSISASYINIPIKSGIINSSSFQGTPKTASVVFAKQFLNNNYSIVITGNSARLWTVENQTTLGFIINSNTNENITGSTFWNAVCVGEYN